MTFVPPDQQPISRVIGRRKNPPPGRPPSPEEQVALAAMAQYRTRAPKGVYFYASHEEMRRDRERWAVEAIVARQRAR